VSEKRFSINNPIGRSNKLDYVDSMLFAQVFTWLNMRNHSIYTSTRLSIMYVCIVYQSNEPLFSTLSWWFSRMQRNHSVPTLSNMLHLVAPNHFEAEDLTWMTTLATRRIAQISLDQSEAMQDSVHMQQTVLGLEK